MKNQKNGSNAPKMHFWAKLPIRDTPKVWACGSPYFDGNENLVSTPIMKNQKNGSNVPTMHPRSKLPITNLLKFGSAVLRMLMEMQNWCLPL